MRRDDICLYLNSNDRAELQAQVADRNTPRKLVWRVGIVLATADENGGDIPCSDQFRATPIMIDGVAGDVDVDDFSGFQLVPPDPCLAPPFRDSRNIGSQRGPIFIRANIGDRHREEFLVGIPVFGDSGIVDRK
jgi:hypothetical protein